MKHPSHLFLKSLVLRGKTPKEIIDIVGIMDLPGMEESELSEYVVGLTRQYKGKLISDFQAGSVELEQMLRDEKVYFLIHPNETTAACARILDHGAARRDTYLSLIGRMTPQQIADHLNRAYELDVTSRVVTVFTNYYFDCSRMSYAEWGKILPYLSGGDEVYYKGALDGGAAVVAYKLGLEQNITVRDAVKLAVEGLYASLLEIKAWPATPSKVKILSDAVSALAKAHAVVNSADQELATVATELRQFKLDRKQRPNTVPLKVLTKGNHSGVGEEVDRG
jgi:hypothetical protein